MRGRRWTVEEKLSIVLEGVKGDRPVSEICKEHGVSLPLYYKWRNRFIEGGRNGLERATGLKEKELLRKEIERLQRLVGKQALEIETLKRAQELISRG
ncbi:MAG: transposase [Candidatus Glassbacteria bacterium]